MPASVNVKEYAGMANYLVLKKCKTVGSNECDAYGDHVGCKGVNDIYNVVCDVL
jgi:hypothetical protein